MVDQFKLGSEWASQTLAEFREPEGFFDSKPSKGILVAEGDSWFDYPRRDVLEYLERDHGYDVVESLAHAGDTLEEIAYEKGQLLKVVRFLKKLANREEVPTAILLSGGGNDIAGKEFKTLLNHKLSGLPALNEGVVSGLIDVKLSAAMRHIIGALQAVCMDLFDKEIPFLIHGYGNAVPDGDGFLGGWGPLPGPWMKPGFQKCGYWDPEDKGRSLVEMTSIVEELITHFNRMLKDVAEERSFIHYVDVPPVLPNTLPEGYKEWWANELHPTKKGFRAVADEFAKVLETF